MHPQTPETTRAQTSHTNQPALKVHHETIVLPPALAERLARADRKQVSAKPDTTIPKLGAKRV